MRDTTIDVCGDDLISLATDGPGQSQRLARRLRAGDWLEVVPGVDSVVVQFDAARIDVADAVGWLEQVRSIDESEPQDMPLVEIAVAYGGNAGKDFERLCDELGMTRDEFIGLHTGREYAVDMLGFTPGFAYVGGLDARLDVPRLAEPRQQVAAGSIGIAGGRTGIYALPGPGGWPLIGRTPTTLFDADADEPFLLSAGTRIRFVALDEADA